MQRDFGNNTNKLRQFSHVGEKREKKKRRIRRKEERKE
jgi:hypothetical protein